MPALPVDPRSAYADRLAARSADVERLAARIDRVGQARMTAFVAGVVAALAGWVSGLFPAWWAAGFALVFVALVIHTKLLRDRKARAARAVRYYQHGLDRLADRW